MGESAGCSDTRSSRRRGVADAAAQYGEIDGEGAGAGGKVGVMNEDRVEVVSVLGNEIWKNCIGCVHNPNGVCVLTEEVPEHRCKYFEVRGKSKSSNK